ncbi:liprin-beta-2-like [Formica exsecta]|uniref:liprin-beta-2-like n=1 Tax=Formica exsecta TaxID=72781 RepID=UPI0011426EED|nr:liprin-beta-2-like [Formica exsecta]
MVMGKGEERNGTTAQAGESTFLAKSSSEASKMLEAALLQMDDIISGACAESSTESGSSEWKNSVKEAARNLVTAIKSAPSPPPPPDAVTEDILLQWMQPVSRQTKIILRSVPASILFRKPVKDNSNVSSAASNAMSLSSWTKDCEEPSNGCDLRSQSDSSDAASTIKLWNSRWTPSEGYDSSGTSSDSDVGDEYVEDYPPGIARSTIACQTAYRSQECLCQGERFSRHTGQYSSLPRPPTSKKGVAFGKVPNLVSGAHTTVPLAVRGIAARCLSAPILAEEAKIVICEASAEPLPPKPLAELTMEEIGDWLARLGLECYAAELRRWGATGLKLLDSTQVQLEKELDVKNILHRKKLLYAIESERSNGAGFLGSQKMDNGAVLRWLDDIGLPQHKEAFHQAKIDGRVLHRLTTEDLLNLGVTAQLHAASLRRGIQVLRDLNFEFDNLERRSANGNGADGSNVTLWTNHRVMEWLRVVDLAEYAPNMRGSGVHGGLIIHEGRFTSELLATLLSIPPSKTLLRRHLTTHFNQILGREVVQHKREIESTLGFVPLTLTARLKVPKKSQFTLKRKKSKNEMDFGNLVCPLEASPPGTPSTPSSTPGSPNLNSPTF